MEPGSEERKEVEAAMARGEEIAIDDNNLGEFTHYSFRRRQEVPGLQCADCVCWVAYRFALFAFLQTPLNEFARVGWEDFGGPLEENGWLGAITIERHHLEKWYQDAMSNPENMEKYRTMEERRLAKQRSRRTTA
jgi:hypothetical protein